MANSFFISPSSSSGGSGNFSQKVTIDGRLGTGWVEFGLEIDGKSGDDAGILLFPGAGASPFIEFQDAGGSASAVSRLGRNPTGVGAALFVGAGGNVSDALQIGSRDVTAFQIFTHDVCRIFVGSDGKVGIGTAVVAPVYLVDVQGGSISTDTGLVSPLITLQVDNIATGSPNSIVLQNTTAATLGVPIQRSPAIKLTGHAWDTDGVDRQIDWTIQSIPVSSATPTGTIAFNVDVGDGGGFANAWQVNSAGNVNQSGSITAGGSLKFTSVGSIQLGASGQFKFVDNPTTSGVGLDFATDGLLKVRTRAFTGYATVDALGYKVSGSAGASFGPSVVTSITVVNGLITAIS